MMGFFGSGGGLAKFGSTLSKIGDGLGYGLDYAMGNDRGVARYEERQAENEARRIAEQRMTQLRESLKSQGLTDQQVEIALLNPESIGTNFNQRFQPPKQPEPTTLEREYGFLNKMNPTYGEQFIQNKVDPEIMAPGPNGLYIGPRSQMGLMFGGGQPTPPPPQPQPAPSREEYGRFVDSLRPELRQKAWEAFNSGQMGSVPSGSPLNPNLGGNPPRISSQDEYNRLPSGTEFIAPDGSRRRKP